MVYFFAVLFYYYNFASKEKCTSNNLDRKKEENETYNLFIYLPDTAVCGVRT